MKILIIGACGFIGFNVFEFLQSKKKNQFLLIDNFSGESSKKNFEKIKLNYKKLNLKK